MNRTIRTAPLTADAFAPFGDVLQAEGPPDKLINAGLCGRFHDRARLRLEHADGDRTVFGLGPGLVVPAGAEPFVDGARLAPARLDHGAIRGEGVGGEGLGANGPHQSIASSRRRAMRSTWRQASANSAARSLPTRRSIIAMMPALS